MLLQLAQLAIEQFARLVDLPDLGDHGQHHAQLATGRRAQKCAELHAQQARTVEAEPDPAWVSRETGMAIDEWSAVPGEEGFDTLEWRVPDRLRRISQTQPLVLHDAVVVTEPEPIDAKPAESRPA